MTKIVEIDMTPHYSAHIILNGASLLEIDDFTGELAFSESYVLPSNFGTVTAIYDDSAIIGDTALDLMWIQEGESAETPEEGVIYLVPASEGAAGNNTYEEYMWINDSWECLGSTNIDLSNYYTKDAAEARDQEVDTILEGNDAEMATLAAQITNLSNQIADLRIQLGDEMGTAYRLQNTTVSINEVSMQVGSSNSAAQLKSDGNTLEVVTNGATTLKADGEKLYANNISTDGSIEAGSHKQQIFNTGSETRTGWFYTGGGQ